MVSLNLKQPRLLGDACESDVWSSGSRSGAEADLRKLARDYHSFIAQGLGTRSQKYIAPLCFEVEPDACTWAEPSFFCAPKEHCLLCCLTMSGGMFCLSVSNVVYCHEFLAALVVRCKNHIPELVARLDPAAFVFFVYMVVVQSQAATSSPSSALLPNFGGGFP